MGNWSLHLALGFGTFGLVLIALLFTAFEQPALAVESNVNVSAVVEAPSVSFTVEDGVVQYGALAAGTSQDTTTSGINDTQVIHYTGNIPADFNIKGQDSADWTLSNSAGIDQYVHGFCPGNCDSGPVWTNLTTNYQELAVGVTPGLQKPFDLRVTTPTSSSSVDAQVVDVTIQAVGT